MVEILILNKTHLTMNNKLMNVFKRITTKHLFILSMISIFIIYVIQQCKLSTDTIYTVGRIYKVVEYKYEYIVNYVYYVDGLAYKSSMPTPKTVKIGECVIVKLSRKYPKTSFIELGYVIRDSSILPNSQVYYRIPKEITRTR